MHLFKVLHLSILLWFFVLLSCAENANSINHVKNHELAKTQALVSISADTSEPQFNLSPILDSLFDTKTGFVIDEQRHYKDTILARSVDELVASVKSNRLIKLIGKAYVLPSSFIIEGVEHLKLEGTKKTTLSVVSQNQNTLHLRNSRLIHLDSLSIGHTDSTAPLYNGTHGALMIQEAYNIVISTCKILGAGTFGFVTNSVHNMTFNNSEITLATLLIFDIQRSKNIRFENATFHNNNLAVSVLGGFTHSSHDISFLNCSLIDNTPESRGNPAFNFFENEKIDPVVFTHCTFKNNKGFKWYGDQIKLQNCQVDSLDFIGF